MIRTIRIRYLVSAVAAGGALVATLPLQAAGSGWSVVPYLGVSQLGDQSPDIASTDDLVDGGLDVAIDTGFSAGFGARYNYPDSRWTSEFGWEYRSNDAETTTADGVVLPDGNYASNIFYLNGRYALSEGSRLTPWIGGGLTWIQEIDLDSEDTDGERSFSDSGSVGFQVMAGADYDLTERVYLTGDVRYSSQSDLDLKEEGGSGRVSGLDYKPVTVGLGLGFRF